MDVSKFIKVELAKAGKNQSWLADTLGMSKQNLSIRMTRNTWKISDLESIANALECDLLIDFKPRG